MSDYYIRIPEENESRGPFDINKLLTLAEAGHVHENTLYFDEEKEEWIPIGLNESLKREVFPEKERLALKTIDERKKEARLERKEKVKAETVEEMLTAAKGNTKQNRRNSRRSKSIDRAASVSTFIIGTLLVFSAFFFILPIVDTARELFHDEQLGNLLNYPAVWIAAIALSLAILIFLSVTELYPLVRFRAALGLGFSTYVCWSLGNPGLGIIFAFGSICLYLSTLINRLFPLLFVFIIGLLAKVLLAYLALQGKFDAFFEFVTFARYTF